MSPYVKICPRCSTVNPEDEQSCRQCRHFLGMVRAERIEQEAAPGPVPEPLPGGSPKPEAEIIRLGASGKEQEPASILYLECKATGRTVPVRPGDMVGQAHPLSQAQVQLSSIPGIEYVSRHHCWFQMDGEGWTVTALPESLNPTMLNGLTLAVSGKMRVSDGDELSLAGVLFRIRL